MNDFIQLKEIFSHLGLTELKEIYKGNSLAQYEQYSENENILSLAAGGGTNGLRVDFHFDSEGTLKEHYIY